jgi:hypothetical protein
MVVRMKWCGPLYNWVASCNMFILLFWDEFRIFSMAMSLTWLHTLSAISASLYVFPSVHFLVVFSLQLSVMFQYYFWMHLNVFHLPWYRFWVTWIFLFCHWEINTKFPSFVPIPDIAHYFSFSNLKLIFWIMFQYLLFFSHLTKDTAFSF